MYKVIVNVVNADFYDAIQIFVDGVAYGRKTGNSSFEIPVAEGLHIIHGIYNNNEPDYEHLSHALNPLEICVVDEDVRLTVKIKNIFSGAKLEKIG